MSGIEAVWQTHRSGVRAPTMMGTSLMGCDLRNSAGSVTFQTVESLSCQGFEQTLTVWQPAQHFKVWGVPHLKTCAMKGMCSSKLCSACGIRAPAAVMSLHHAACCIESYAVLYAGMPLRPRLLTSSALRLMV